MEKKLINNKEKIIYSKIDKISEEIPIQNLNEIVNKANLEYQEVAEVLKSLRPST